MTPQAIKELREYLQLTQEAFAHILGVSFATVNRWENRKADPTGDYARVLYTLQQLTAPGRRGPPIDWKRVGALSTMAAMVGFSPLLTLGAALAPVLVAQLPSWSELPYGAPSAREVRSNSRQHTTKNTKSVASTSTSPRARTAQAREKLRIAGKRKSQRTTPRRRDG